MVIIMLAHKEENNLSVAFTIESSVLYKQKVKAIPLQA
jgi:hypothetical protein